MQDSCLRRSERDYCLAQVRSEGMPQSVDVERPALVVAFRNPSRLQVSIENRKHAGQNFEQQRFQRAYVAGMIPVEERVGRVRFVRDSKSPLAVPYSLAHRPGRDGLLRQPWLFRSSIK